MKPATIFRKTAQMFESGEYTGHYACDALGVIPGAVAANGFSSPQLDYKKCDSWIAFKDAYASVFAPTEDEARGWPGDAPNAWWSNRDERILSLYFAAALAEKGDL